MLVGSLKKNLQSALVTLVPVSLSLVIITVLTVPPPDPSNHLYPQHILYNYIDFRLHAPWLIQTLNLAIILLSAVMVNFLAVRQEIVSKNNYVPAFLYTLFGFSTISNAFIHPALVANVFVIAGFYFFFDTYRMDRPLTTLFKASFFMGLAPFFYTNDLVMLPFCFFALVILRSFQWREWGITILGIFLPIYMFMALSYLLDKNPWHIFHVFRESVASLQLPSVSEYYYPFLLMVVVLFILSMVFMVGRGFGSKVKTQKAKYILLWFMLALSVNIFSGHDCDFLFVSLSVPLSIVLGDYLAEIRQLKIANTLMVLLLGTFALIYLHRFSII